jgi:hypothetical protein
MSGGDAAVAENGNDSSQRFGTIVIVGGGCYGSYYVRQLGRAARAGAVTWQRLWVVDREAHCRVAQEVASDPAPPGRPAEVIVSDWSAFFDRYLGNASLDRAGTLHDAIVPSPLMPHLMFDWLRARAGERWPERPIEVRPLDRVPNTPWQRAAPDGTHYVSFAEWMCPINCVEPPLCPEIAGPRTWSLPPALRAYVDEERRLGHPLVGPVIFHCRHRAYGVGMFDTRDVVAADDLVMEAGRRGAADVLVGTVSHCHGAINRLVVGPARLAEAGSVDATR